MLCERLTNRKAEHYVTPAMEWGIDNEPLARGAYELEFDVQTQSGGLAMHDRIKWLMASPDGLVGDDGLVECKFPTTSTHIEDTSRRALCSRNTDGKCSARWLALTVSGATS